MEQRIAKATAREYPNVWTSRFLGEKKQVTALKWRRDLPPGTGNSFSKCFFGFAEKFQRYPQHSKAFALVFAQMFVVHFVGAPDCTEINRIGVPENFEPLMDKYIVHHEIGK